MGKKVKCNYCAKVHEKFTAQVNKNKTGIFYCDNECRAKELKKRTIVSCEVCSSMFRKNSADQKRYPRHCCSIECRSKLNRKSVSTPCSNCEQIVVRAQSQIKGKSNIFCSKECHDEFQTTKLKIKCNLCGKDFAQHKCIIERTKHGQNYCSHTCSSKVVYKESFIETEMEKLVKPIGLKYSRNDRSIVSPLELDFYFPDINYAIEINGLFHYEPIYGKETLLAQKERDSRKRRLCKEKGIILRVVKPGNCKDGTYMKRLKRVVWEIRKIINEQS